ASPVLVFRPALPLPRPRGAAVVTFLPPIGLSSSPNPCRRCSQDPRFHVAWNRSCGGYPSRSPASPTPYGREPFVVFPAVAALDALRQAGLYGRTVARVAQRGFR